VTEVDDVRGTRLRRGGIWGLAFVVLLLVGAGMASVPGGDESVAEVRRFYDEHAGVVLLSQLVELVATVPLVLFLLGLAASRLVRSRHMVPTGSVLVVASVLTLVPPLLLVLLHDHAPGGQVHALAVLSDLTDVVLFAAIAVLAVVLWSGPGPQWFRLSALLVGLVTAVRAVEILFGGDLLEVVAPVGFILLVVVSSVLLMMSERPAGP
jgi:hypothetical protein